MTLVSKNEQGLARKRKANRRNSYDLACYGGGMKTTLNS
jgi:hypothetical protein